MGSIQVGRWSDLLRRAFSMVGQLDVAAELSPEVSPTWELESAADVQWDFLKRVKQCSSAEAVVANVGAGAQFRLRNPPDSLTLATVNFISMVCNALNPYAITIGRGTADLANGALTTARDTRWRDSPTGNQAIMIASFQNAVGAVPVGAGTIYRGRAGGNNELTYETPFVLDPGTFVTFGGLTANLLVDFAIDWKERGTEPLEL